jgi:hypothetical protein
MKYLFYNNIKYFIIVKSTENNYDSRQKKKALNVIEKYNLNKIYIK